MRPILFLLTFLVLLAACGAPPNSADQGVTAGSLHIKGAWARPAQMMGGSTSAAYMVIENSGSAPDRLIRVSGDLANAIELHTATNNNGVMEMRPVEAIEVPASSSVELKPGGYHIMMIGVKQPLKPDDTVPLTLTFAQAGNVNITATVRSP